MQLRAPGLAGLVAGATLVPLSATAAATPISDSSMLRRAVKLADRMELHQLNNSSLAPINRATWPASVQLCSRCATLPARQATQYFTPLVRTLPVLATSGSNTGNRLRDEAPNVVWNSDPKVEGGGKAPQRGRCSATHVLQTAAQHPTRAVALDKDSARRCSTSLPRRRRWAHHGTRSAARDEHDHRRAVHRGERPRLVASYTADTSSCFVAFLVFPDPATRSETWSTSAPSPDGRRGSDRAVLRSGD